MSPPSRRWKAGLPALTDVTKNVDSEALGLATWVAAAYFVVEYARLQDVVFPLQYLKLGIIVLVLGAYVLSQRQYPYPREARAILLYIGALVAATPFAANPKVAVITTLTVLQMLISGAFVVMTSTDSMRKLRFLLWAFAAAGTYQSVRGILLDGVGVGYFIDENDLCMLAAGVAPIAYALAVTAKGMSSRLVGFLLLFLAVLAGVVSFSRGGFLAMVAVLLYLILRSPRRVATLLAIAVALAIVFPFVPSGWYAEMETIKTADQYGDTGETRIYMWGIAWHVFLTHPIVGVAPNNLGRHMSEFDDPATGHRPMWGRACHSLWFTLLSESGAVGTALWLWMLAVSLKTTHRVAKIASRAKSHSPPYAAATLLKARQLMAICRGLEASLIGFLVAGTFLTTNYYPNLWTIIGFMSATRLVLEMDPDLAVLKNPAPEPALVSGFVRAASR